MTTYILCNRCRGSGLDPDADTPCSKCSGRAKWRRYTAEELVSGCLEDESDGEIIEITEEENVRSFIEFFKAISKGRGS